MLDGESLAAGIPTEGLAGMFTSRLLGALCTAVLIASASFPCTPLGANYTLIDLGALGGASPQGYGINASGQVTGFSRITGDAGD